MFSYHKFSYKNLEAMEGLVWCLAIASPLILGVNSDKKGDVKAMFMFGDSLLDPGNNNNLFSLAKANFLPNGIDFPAGVTGRFCNGGTIADHLGNLLGFQLIPPFNNPNTTGSKILNGVNFASGAGGILNDTGKLFGDLFSMDQQIQNFRDKTLPELRLEFGSKTQGFLDKSLFFVWMGNNDYINNYLFPFSTTPLKYTIDAFHQLLIQEYSRQLKDLYDLGGRKFLVAGLVPLGCIPNQIGYFSNKSGACVDRTNEMASEFNDRLKKVVNKFNKNLSGASFLYWDTYAELMDVIANPSHYGFKYSRTACCGGGRFKGQIICLPLLNLECRNRSEFVFWDPYHTTDALNAIAARKAFQGSLKTIYPMNVQQLLQL